jgi:hypothetical protein
LVTVAAISQVPRHPSRHRQAEEEAGAVAVVVGVKALPFLKIPDAVGAWIDREGRHGEQLAREGKEDKSVAVTDLINDATKNLGREKQDGRLLLLYSSSRRQDHRSFFTETSLLGNSRALITTGISKGRQW